MTGNRTGKVAPRHRKPDEPMVNLTRIKPQHRTREARELYLSRPSVRKWLRRNARRLEVLDVRYFSRLDEYMEWAEVFYVGKGKNGRPKVKCKIISGDPPPLTRAMRNGR